MSKFKNVQILGREKFKTPNLIFFSVVAEAEMPEVVEISAAEAVGMESEVVEAEEEEEEEAAVEVMAAEVTETEEAVEAAAEEVIMITKIRQIISDKIEEVLKEVTEQRITLEVKNHERRTIFNLPHKILLVMVNEEDILIIEMRVKEVAFKEDGIKAILIISVVVIIVEDVIIIKFLRIQVNCFFNFSILEIFFFIKKRKRKCETC